MMLERMPLMFWSSCFAFSLPASGFSVGSANSDGASFVSSLLCLMNFFATDFGIPMLLWPVLAAYMAFRCFSDTKGIEIP